MPELNTLDRAIGYAFPRWGARRVEARARIEGLEYVRAMYDGATKSSRSGFRGIGGTSANAEVLGGLSRLRDASRDLVRNNPYARSCVAGISGNVVGNGITPAVYSDSARTKKRVQDLLKEHLDTPLIDFDGRNNLYGLQDLITRTLVEAGEALVVRYTPPARMRLPVPAQVRVLDPDYLDGSKHGPQANGNVCFDGIEFEKTGRRAAYWLYEEHPGGGMTWSMPGSRRVPAEDVSHVFRVDRPGQARGIPWGAPVILTLWDLHDYEGAELLRQKIAACWAVFITGDSPKTLADKVSTTEKTRAGTPLETVEPGSINRIPNGTAVTFGSPPAAQGFADVTRHSARKVGCGFGCPYEIASGDLSQVTFISGRLGLNRFDRDSGQWRSHIIIPHGCAPIGRWFLEAAMVPLNGPIKARIDWTPPPKFLVDPKIEVTAARERIRAGLSTRSEETRSLGFDPEDVELEFAEENERADNLGLRFDSDGRYPMNGAVPPLEDPDKDDKREPGDNDNAAQSAR